jgi:hypothetical protein
MWVGLFEPIRLYQKHSLLAIPPSSTGKPVIYLLGSQYTGPPERAAEFERWYADEHAPLMLELGATAAVRYRAVPGEPDGEEGSPPPLLTIYDFDDLAHFEDVEARLGVGREHFAATWAKEDLSVRWAASFEALP